MKSLLSILLAVTLVFLIQGNVGIVEGITGVPVEIVTNALENGAVPAILFGTKNERHRFAKGQPTRFGHMTFDADVYLQKKKGWSESKIHNFGFVYGFSVIRPKVEEKENE